MRHFLQSALRFLDVFDEVETQSHVETEVQPITENWKQVTDFLGIIHLLIEVFKQSNDVVLFHVRNVGITDSKQLLSSSFAQSAVGEADDKLLRLRPTVILADELSDDTNKGFVRSIGIELVIKKRHHLRSYVKVHKISAENKVFPSQIIYSSHKYSQDNAPFRVRLKQQRLVFAVDSSAQAFSLRSVDEIQVFDCFVDFGIFDFWSFVVFGRTE